MDDVRADSEPTQESWNVHYVISEAGSQANESRTRFEIIADYMATFETPDSTYTVMQSSSNDSRVLAYMYDEAGDTSATLRADRLILHDEDRTFEAMDNVVVITPDEKRLESEHLVWLEADRTLRTPGFVRIETPEERVQGYNLTADEDLTTYTLARVTGQVTVEDDTEEAEPEVEVLPGNPEPGNTTPSDAEPGNTTPNDAEPGEAASDETSGQIGETGEAIRDEAEPGDIPVEDRENHDEIGLPLEDLEADRGPVE